MCPPTKTRVKIVLDLQCLQPHHLRKMISNAWAWADQKPGRKRKNPVHGEEEIRFVLHDTFEFLDEEAEQTMLEGGVEVED